MKKLFIFVGILIVLSIGVFFIVSGFSNDEEKAGASNSEQKKVVSKSIDDMHSNYEVSGKECKSIEDTLERGNCFRTVNAKYLTWNLQILEGLYYPDIENSEQMQDVLFYTIDQSDELGELHKTDYYDEYVEKKSLKAAEKGTEVIQSYWHILSNVFPREYRQHLKKITWMDSGNHYLFMVSRDEENPKDTAITFSHKVDTYSSDFKHTLLHELGHVLSLSEEDVRVDEDVFLNSDQELVKAKEAECSTLYVLWGCMKEDSYLNLYYQEFWKDIDAEHAQIDWNAEDDFKEFYNKYEDRFLSTYQGTHPAEDLAESFAYFIMMDPEDLKGQAEMKYDKIEFFYQFEELVELRTAIVENFYDLSVKDGVFY